MKTQGYVASANEPGKQKEMIQPAVIGHNIIKGAYEQKDVPSPKM